MKSNSLLFAFATLLVLARGATAATVVIDDKRCVPASAQRTHDSITNYKSYVNLPGARYAVKIPGYGEMALLTMVKSQENKNFQRAVDKTDGFAWVVLQPTSTTNGDYYPQFLLHCTSAFDSKTHFTHHCKLQADKRHYGLEDFISDLDVVEGASECGGDPAKSYLVYKLTLVSNDAHVAKIKEEVLKPLSILGDIVGAFFDEEAFFRNYYMNFYNGWVKTL